MLPRVKEGSGIIIRVLYKDDDIREEWVVGVKPDAKKPSQLNCGYLGEICKHRTTTVGEGNSNPLQFSWLENPHGQWSWRATVHGVTRVRYN